MYIKLLRENAQLPTLGSAQAAGYDLYAAFEDTMYGSMEIPPHETRMIPTGIAISIPQDFWGGIYARSGLATKQGLRPANCVGVIDSDYRGEIFVALHNDSNDYRYVCNGDRIAQLIIHSCCYHWGWEVVDNLDPTERGKGGFGSTGNN